MLSYGAATTGAVGTALLLNQTVKVNIILDQDSYNILLFIFDIIIYYTRRVEERHKNQWILTFLWTGELTNA